MGVEKQWPTRVAALERVAALCASAPKQTAACLPTLVPELTPSLWDTKKEVKAAAKAAVTAAFGLSGNRDVEPVIPKLVSSASNPKEVELGDDGLDVAVAGQAEGRRHRRLRGGFHLLLRVPQ